MSESLICLITGLTMIVKKIKPDGLCGFMRFYSVSCINILSHIARSNIHRIFAVIMMASISGSAQQNPNFSNYLFNNYGINPAYLAKGNCLDVRIGRRNQWVGFPNGPLMTFISFNKSFKKKAFRNYWHGIGLYLEQDKMDAIKSDAAYFNYSYHLRVSDDYFASFGMFAGAKAYSMSLEYFDEADPAFQALGNVVVPLDIAVGARLYSKTNFFDFAVRNTYMNKIKLGPKQVGTPSKLVPHINIIAGRRIESGAYYYTYVPSVNVRWALMSPPSVDLSFMMFIKKKIGFGLSYRYNDAIIGLFQYKYKNSLSIAMGYDYMLSRLRVGSSGITGPSSREIMLGFNSCPPGQDIQRSTGCPAYDK